MSKRETRRSRAGWRWLPFVAGALVLASPFVAWVVPTSADDGPMVRHPVSRTPDMESEDAQLSMMQFYVTATSRNGEPTVLEYYADRDGDNQPDELIETREYAKPLFASYFDEVPVGSYKSASLGAKSGVELSPETRRDAFGAISLDDGKTWKERNLSESALETSFTLENGIEYPGDVPEVLHAVAGNKIVVAWTSKYCAQGSPRYSVKADTDLDGNGELDDPLYEDLYDVAGNQGSIDYAEWMHHGTYPFAEVGEIPFSCVWTARGTVQQVVNPQTGALQWGVQWRKAERLTSGKRDAYYLAIDGVEGAGFVLAWQEDPEGLRPGYGEGPGIGWSGATVNHKTDIWYSRIGWDEFDGVEYDPEHPDTNQPKPLEKMTMPIRLTDNYNCLSDRVDSDGNPHPGFCFEDFNGNGVADFCAEVYPWTNTQGELKNICVTEDGRLLNGQTGSSRTRLMLEGYTRPDGTKSAWVVLSYEETKGLGEGHTDVEPLDIGKDVMYQSFDMFAPQFVAPGTMLNMPETDPLSDPLNPTILPLVLNDKGEYQYETTIGRRPSLVVQPGYKLAEAAAAGDTYGMTSAIVLYKDGEQRQGGPSDAFMRRFVLPAGFNPAYHNPYDPQYLACDLADTAIVTSSPSAYPASAYPGGVCLRGARNVSGTTPLTLEPLDNTDGIPVVMPDWHPVDYVGRCSDCHGNITDDGNQIEGIPSHGIIDRVLTWEQTPANLLDTHWANKYEVAKGHRGFIDGDFVVLMYAHSPNWLATSHGHEPYNLYIRRSFDGGVTWTTTPASFGGDGTTYEQIFGVGDRVWSVTRTLGAGEFEPARNVSQLTSNKDTVLDPRYSPTNMGTQRDVDRILQPDGTYVFTQPYPLDDTRDPSKFFAVYETGDATTVLEGGEADPLDLFFSRAVDYGDDWDTYDHYVQSTGLYEERWDWLESKKDVLSGEASIGASPGGAYLWAVWNEWMETEDGHVYESDPVFRRLWWDDSATLVAEAGTYYAAAGEIVTLVGSAEYSTSAATTFATRAATELTYFWDLDGDGFFEVEGRTVRFPATGAPQAVALRVCDGGGVCDIDQGWVNPDPFVPRVWRIRPDPVPAFVGSLVTVTGRFNMPGRADLASVVWGWGDGEAPEPGILPEELQGQGASFVAGSHVFTAAGVYPVTLTVTDEEGRVGFDLEYVAVVDPGAGFVTGEGTLPSPAGDFYFQLDAKYDKKKGNLKGQAVIALEAAAMSFTSDSLDWLAVAPTGMAHLQGTGILNGKGGYYFLLTLFDDQDAGDRARVRIWHGGAGKNGHLMFDSQVGDPIGADATGLVQGNVTLHVD
jgi:hypothetical protein